MSLLDRLLRRPDLTKGLAVPAGARTYTVEEIGATLEQQGLTISPATQMPWVDQMTAFGPGRPITPAPIDPPGASGRPEPRLSEYPVSFNLPGTGQLELPWKVLRQAADNIGLVRRCIEVRKQHMSTANWGFTITDRAVKRALAAAGDTQPRNEIEKNLRDSLADDIARAEQFWLMPDRANGLNFGDWIGELLEEHFVLDALAIYPRRTRGGQPYSLEILDGSTIKPLLDHRGARPMAPNPAYQQILHGFPRGEFAATTVDGEIVGGYQADQLIYKRRNVRAFTPYGFPAVEQALFDAEVWLRRQQWIKAEYTDGTMPAGWLKVSATGTTEITTWSPTQLAEYERALNDMWSGDTAARHRFKIMPPGLEPEERRELADKYKPDYDLFLIKLLLSHFDVTPAEMGFMESTGLGGASFHEGQSDVQDRKGQRPTEQWLARFLTEVSHTVLGISTDVEFTWVSEDDDDEQIADTISDQRVKGGRSTLNEDRDRQGKPRYSFPEADMPMIVTNTGITFLQGELERQATAQATAAADAAKHTEDPDEPTDEPPGDEDDPAKGTPPEQAKKTELAALRKFLAKGDRTRPFVAKHLTTADVTAAGLDPAAVLTKDGGAGGRPSRRQPEGGVDGLGALREGRQLLHVPYRPGC